MNTTAIANQEIKEIKPNQGPDKWKEDWVECDLGEICEVYAGVGFPKNLQGKTEGDFPFYKVGDISKNVQAKNRYLKLCDNYLDKGDIPKIENKLLPPNSIAFAKIGEALKLNRRCITIGYSLVDNNAIGIKAKEILNDLFLYFFFLTVQLEKYSRATTVPSVRKTDIETIAIPLPPLPIQRAIVKKIEELFSSLDSGIADLKKAQEQLVIYRQAVLKKAFEGSKEVLFEEIITTSQNGLSKRKGIEGSEIKVLRLADISNLEIDNSTSRSILLNENELNKYRLNEGDLVVIRVNGSINLVGRFVYVDKKSEKEIWAFCDHFIRFTLDLNKYVPKFYYYYFQLPKVRKFINHNMVSSAGQNTVSQTTIKSILVPLSSVEKQQTIVREIESRLSVCDKVEESITESLEKAQALRQSILKKAFEGKLLSNAEIEQCKKEKDYEPASVLLERIKKEKK